MATTATFLTFNIVKLEMLSGAEKLGDATGFFYKSGDKWFLVTNWHVLSGRDPATGQPRSGFQIPDHCRFYYSNLSEDGLISGSVTYRLDDPNTGRTRWLQHQSQGQDVDIAAFEVDAQHIGHAKDLAERDGSDPDMVVDIGGEIFLPGFPLGLHADSYLPLWKRASLACSLEIGAAAHTFFYVDTATREGMSGSPCFAISNWKHYSVDRNTNQIRVVERPISWRLLGIYSGRFNATDTFEAQIGKVWCEPLIRDVLERGVPGDPDFR